MEIEPPHTTGKGPVERFTGDVWVDIVTQPRPGQSRLTAGIVRFAPGARTAWHVHACGQTLHVIEGLALVQARGGQTVLLRPGETVYTPPGEWHWHGAAESNFMTHLALSEITTQDEGPAVTWGGHVSDDDYRTACSTVCSPEDPANEHSIQPNPEAR